MTTSHTDQPSGSPRVSARQWFASGRRRAYDPAIKALVETAGPGRVQVFEKVVIAGPLRPGTRWLTMLPGYPDGSFGYAQVDRQLGVNACPRLYVEYVGQGDSDTPDGYRYSSFERADLVAAQWHAHGVRRTMVVTFDFSSLTLLELLRRQLERGGAATVGETVIDAVFIINGGLFADAHSHPWATTPMLRTPVGRAAMWGAQNVGAVMERTLRNAQLFGSDFTPTDAEIRDLSDAIRRNDGAAFMHRAAGFVHEHRRYAARWDLAAIARELQGTVAIHIAGSEQDPFEPRQIDAARRRLTPREVDIEIFPGGHLTTSEHPDLLANAIRGLAHAHGVGEQTTPTKRVEP